MGIKHKNFVLQKKVNTKSALLFFAVTFIIGSTNFNPTNPGTFECVPVTKPKHMPEPKHKPKPKPKP